MNTPIALHSLANTWYYPTFTFGSCEIEFIFFLRFYLFMRDTQRGREKAEGEAGSLRGT